MKIFHEDMSIHPKAYCSQSLQSKYFMCPHHHRMLLRCLRSLTLPAWCMCV